MTPRLMTGSATDVDEQDPSALEFSLLVADCVQLDFFLPHRLASLLACLVAN
jgi:hypothetical protein